MADELEKFRIQLGLMRDAAVTAYNRPAAKCRKPQWESKGTDMETSRAVLCASAGSLDKQVAKFAIVLKSKPDSEQTRGICNHTLQPLEKLISAYDMCIFCGLTASLKKQMQKFVHGILDALTQLADICKTILVSDDVVECEAAKEKVNPTTGVVMEYCVELNKMPKTNKVAVKRAIMQYVGLAKDTVREFEELVQDEPEEPGAGAGADAAPALSMEEQFDEMCFGGDDELSPEEHSRIKKVLAVLNMGEMCLKKTVQELNRIKDLNQAPDTIFTSCDAADGAAGAAADAGAKTPWLATAYAEEAVDLCKTLERAVGDLGCCLYPTQDAEEIQRETTAFAEATNKLLEHLLASPECGEEEKKQLSLGKKRLQSKVSEIESSFK